MGVKRKIERKDCVLPPIRISTAERAEVFRVASSVGLGVSAYLLSLHRAFVDTNMYVCKGNNVKKQGFTNE